MSKRAAATDTGVIEGNPGERRAHPLRMAWGLQKRPSFPRIQTKKWREFEDEWEDEMESDDEVVDRTAEKLDGAEYFFYPKPSITTFSNTINCTGRS